MTALFTLDDILTATQSLGGKLLTTAKPFTKPALLNSDTRSISNNQFFIPLVGANFNGHTFLADALQKGAVGAIVNLSEWDTHQSDWQAFPNLVGVPSTLEGYMALANFHRHRGHPNLKVIALTGSSGKTTTKNMLYASFANIKKTQKTQKNFNNEIGVSQTLLSLEPETELLIVEMGMRGKHQIDILSRCAEPDLALITNIGPAHIEMLGSLDGVAEAKLEITDGLNPKRGVLVTWGDDPMLKKHITQFWQKTHKTYHLSETELISASADSQQFRYEGHLVNLPAPGTHNRLNALAALTVGKVLGLPVDQLCKGLSNYQPEDGRWVKQALKGYDETVIINDAYNANPDSCKASLSTFFEMPLAANQKRILILGGMKELGPFSEQYHRELGTWLDKQPLDALITVGSEAAIIKDTLTIKTFPTIHVDQLAENPSELEAQLIKPLEKQGVLLDHSLILLKGSRAYHLENLIPALEEIRIGVPY